MYTHTHKHKRKTHKEKLWIIIILFLLFDSWNFNNFISIVFVIIFVINSLIIFFFCFLNILFCIISEWRINFFWKCVEFTTLCYIWIFFICNQKFFFFLFLLLLFFIWIGTASKNRLPWNSFHFSCLVEPNDVWKHKMFNVFLFSRHGRSVILLI